MPSTLAELVARHLVAAAMTLDSDPGLALEHARAAAGRVPRIAAAREAVGVAAYHAGDFAAALLELRAARRIDGSSRNLALMADAERGLGRPERAVDYLSDPRVAELDAEARVELMIVASGARRDMGQAAAAAVILAPEATAKGEPKPWSARLWYAYAEALLASGRDAEALRWFTEAAGIDEGETDAAERAYELATGEAAADQGVDSSDETDRTSEDVGTSEDPDTSPGSSAAAGTGEVPVTMVDGDVGDVVAADAGEDLDASPGTSDDPGDGGDPGVEAAVESAATGAEAVPRTPGSDRMGSDGPERRDTTGPEALETVAVPGVIFSDAPHESGVTG